MTSIVTTVTATQGLPPFMPVELIDCAHSGDVDQAPTRVTGLTHALVLVLAALLVVVLAAATVHVAATAVILAVVLVPTAEEALACS